MNDGAFLKQNCRCCFVFWGKPLGSPFLFEDFIIFFFFQPPQILQKDHQFLVW